MADYPKCEHCGKSNWPKQAWMHDLCGKSVVVHKAKADKVVHKVVEPAVVHGESRHGKYADLEKRKKYKREWMARKRAQ